MTPDLCTERARSTVPRATGMKRVLLGSVARNVLQHANCSVLIVREPAADVASVAA